ncbi:MAG: polynucleotide adenylyltransferase [Bacilli bacterium]|nr:polynucleotide adenylyltransferase [Bacilli bacterium]
MYEMGLEILNKLFFNGFRGYIVGGYPRDKYIGKYSNDIDITTNAKYDDLVRIFDNVKENGYMSYIVDYKSYKYQITTFRKDISYIDNRKPDIQETVDTIEEDLKRRDFIINTLCINKDGKYLDILGAKNDIDNKIIRTVKNPNISFKEDSLRILRCIRFASILNFNIDDEVSKAIHNNKELIRNLSFFRKKEELDKIFSNINYQRGIDLIKEYGLEEALSIKIGNNIYGDNYLKVWSKIEYDDNYPFTREEKRILKSYIDNE